MQKKLSKRTQPMLFAIAAFALTASGVHAFGSTELLTKAGLTDEQVVAIQEAQELKASGDFDAARETLEAAGIDRETMHAIRDAAHEAKKAMRDAIEAEDYDAFMEAVADSPIAEFIQNEADFELFVEAHNLRHDGEHEAAEELLAELGIDAEEFGKGKRHMHGGRGHFTAILEQLTDEQQEALEVAKEANDKEAVRAILEEAGIEIPMRGKRGQ